MKQKKVLIAAMICGQLGMLYAQEKVQQLDEIVISDSKFALPKEKSGKIIVQITAKDLESRAGQSVATILSSVAGVEISGNQSSAGKNLGYYIRGARNRQTLVLIDGIPVTDASGINLEYDLRLLTADQIERIEVMKGAASTLYGSGAAAGVINIILKKASKKALAGTAYFSAGSQRTAVQKSYKPQAFNQGFSVNGITSKWFYLAQLNSEEVTGISESIAPIDANYEADRYSKLSNLVKVGYTPATKFHIQSFVSFDQLKNNFDGTFDNFFNPDVVANYATTTQFRAGITPKFLFNGGEIIWQSSFGKTNRTYQIFDNYSGNVDGSDYVSKSVNSDLFAKVTITPELFLVGGTQFQFHNMQSATIYDIIDSKTAKFNAIDPYFTMVFNADFGLNINAGARLYTHSVYDSELVYNFNPSFNVADTGIKLLASYSTAYVTPSLYQLYSPYGNLNLTPEKNSTLEAGFNYGIGNNKVQINAVAFQRSEKNAIGFYTNPLTWASIYVNQAGIVNAKGVEVDLAATVSKNIRLNANYTFTETEAKFNRLLPKQKLNAQVTWQLLPTLSVATTYQYLDKRQDAFFDGGSFVTTPVQLDSYQLVNFMTQWNVLKNRMKLTASIDNIFDELFIENVGYSTRGRNFKLGTTFNF